MSDSKKRPHEADGDYLAPTTDESAPAAKRMKMFDEEDGLTNRPSPVVSDAESTSSSKIVPPYGAHTDPGTRYGPLNQDCYFMDRLKQANGSHVTVLAVFDGHGKHGEKASKLASEFFQNQLRAHLTQPKHVPMHEHEKTIRSIFEGAHKRIIDEYEALTTLSYDGFTFNLMMTADRVDFYSSAECPYVLLQDFGTTAVVCVFWEETQMLMVANCGDSDALIGRWDAVSRQIQPNLLTISDNVSCSTNGEQERIKRDFGRKTKFGGGYLSPNDATYGFHSLAMTRALGHKFLEKYGVTWDPHVRFFQITPEDIVLVVASDGLFDVVNNKAILSLAAERHSVNGTFRTLTPTEASQRLVHLALGNWKKQFNSVDVADNTTVCVFKLSSQFDTNVPQREELSDSGTSFSPALTNVHAFEAEIEETSKDVLSTPPDADAESATPIIPTDEDSPFVTIDPTPPAPPPSLAVTCELPNDAAGNSEEANSSPAVVAQSSAGNLESSTTVPGSEYSVNNGSSCHQNTLSYVDVQDARKSMDAGEQNAALPTNGGGVAVLDPMESSTSYNAHIPHISQDTPKDQTPSATNASSSFGVSVIDAELTPCPTNGTLSQNNLDESVDLMNKCPLPSELSQVAPLPKAGQSESASNSHTPARPSSISEQQSGNGS